MTWPAPIAGASLGGAGLVICLLLVPMATAAQAQALSGVAEWTVARGTSASGDQAAVNNAFWQSYSLNLNAALIDPRLVKYDGGVSYRTSRVTFGDQALAQQGGQHGLSYQLHAALFPLRPFPLTVQWSRNLISESGAMPSTSPVRGGVVVPADGAVGELGTRTGAFSIAWQLNAEGLPHVDLGYRHSNAVTSGSGISAAQRDGDIHATVTKDSESVHQSVRFQRTTYEHVLAETFNQHFSELGYDLDVRLSARSRWNAHAGRRNARSLFDAPAALVDSGTSVATASPLGASDTLFTTSGVTLEPNGRVSLGITASAERQTAAAISTSSRLLTATLRLDPFTGLSLNASGNYGTRGQVVGDAALTVLARAAQAGATYRLGWRWFEATASGSRRIGENSTVDGRMGRAGGWSGDGAVSLSAFGVNAHYGIGRARGDDALLDLGNFDVRRHRASVQAGGVRWVVHADWDRTDSVRGVGATLVSVRQETYAASAGIRHASGQLSASAGGFDSRSAMGRDRTNFVGGSADLMFSDIQWSVSLRQERTAASSGALDQRAMVGFARAEYSRRQFGLVAEYRRNSQRLQLDRVSDPMAFRGRQFSIRILRKFGVRR